MGKLTPALASLPDDYELVGVANTSLASAERAAKAFGLERAFPTPSSWTWTCGAAVVMPPASSR